jgi:hypothetical protein
MDYDVSHYTNEELCEILNVSDDATDADIKANTLDLTNQHQSDPSMVSFLNAAAATLMDTDLTDHQQITLAPIAQDTLNPNLENTYQRLLVLDSYYRPAGYSETDYITPLSSPLKRTLSYRISSIHLPYTWYVFDAAYGNNYFTVAYHSTNNNDGGNSDNIDNNSSAIITIPSGNYTATALVTAINDALATVITFSSVGQGASWNAANGLITLNLLGGTVIADGTVLQSGAQLVWFKSGSNGNNNGNGNNSNNCVTQLPKFFSQSFGWLLGYRQETVSLVATGSAPVDVYGPKFFVLAINDYNHNQINDTVVCMTDNESFWSAVDCHSLVPTAPRIKTQAQLYSANEIAKQRKNSRFSERPSPPLCSNMFAVMPIKRNLNSTIGDIIVETGGNLKDYERTFFGPVDITKLQIKLLDDRGRVVNLNSTDWCITFMVECLYKY